MVYRGYSRALVRSAETNIFTKRTGYIINDFIATY